MAMLDLLHDALDVEEQHRNGARDMVRAIWERDMPAFMAEAAREAQRAGTDDDAPHATMMLALELFVARIAQFLPETVAAAAKDGYASGREQAKGEE
jgi:hypothetical protein